MRNSKYHGTGVKPHAETTPNASGGLSEAGSLRRDFLGLLGKWGATLTLLGLGAETVTQVLFKRSALSSATAGLGVYKDVPPPPVPTGTIYWVGTDGDDNSAGTEAAPFASIPKALRMCAAGDGIYVKAGTYISTEILWKKSGVILRGAPGTTRHQVILEPSGSGSGNAILMDSDQINNGDPPVEDCQIYGLTIQGGPALPDTTNTTARSNNWRAQGIRMRGYVRDVKIINCVVRHVYHRGIFIGNNGATLSESNFPHNIEVAYSDFYLIGTDTAGADISLGTRAGFVHIHHNELHGDVDGVVTSGNHIGSLLEYNHIHDHLGPDNDGDLPSENGIDFKDCHTDNPLLSSGHKTIIRYNVIHGHPWQPGITFQNGSRSVRIYGNELYDNIVGFLVQRGGSHYGYEVGRDITFTDNEVHDNHRAGVVIGSGEHADLIYDNNRIYDNGNREVRPLVSIRAGMIIGSGTNVRFTNNIVSNNGRLSNNVQHYFGSVSQATSNITSNNNTYFLPDSTFMVARVGAYRYTLSEWQSMFGQDRNSTEQSMRYEAPSPPQSPKAIEVSDAGYAKKATGPVAGSRRERRPGVASRSG